MTGKPTNYYSQTYVTILIAIGVFFVFKEILPHKIFENEIAPTQGIVIDSMALSAMNAQEPANIITNVSDTLSLYTKTDTVFAKTNTIEIEPTQHSQGYANLERFFDKLYDLEQNKKGKVRVAYFSDSMTDGDLIVQDIRKEYQQKYGGRGVGFVGITSLSAGSRGSVMHSFSKNWQNQSFLKTQKPRRPFGIDGQVAFVPSGASTWIRYQAGSLAHSTALYNPTLFYGSSANSQASMSIKLNKDSIITEQVSTNKLLNTYRIEGAPNSLKIDFNKSDTIPFYGINFDDGRGVHIDNFSIRGNSGLPLSLLDKQLMNEFDKILHYDLIILHYGANVLHYSNKDYTWYQRGMLNVVNHLKECFPNADFLIISTADKADKVEGEMKTSIAVEPLIKAQSEYAANSQSAMINLYTLMGGYGSMVEWVNSIPALANKDYTHFSIKGAHKIGALIYKDLNEGYQQYKKIKHGIEPATDNSDDDSSNIPLAND